jgi:hypothetical protein
LQRYGAFPAIFETQFVNFGISKVDLSFPVNEKAPRWGSGPRGIKLRRWGRNLMELEEQVLVDSR